MVNNTEMNITLDFDKRNLIIVALLLLLGLGAYYHFTAIGDKNKKIIEERNLHNALTDSVHRYKNKQNELVNEKLTIQTSLKELSDKNLTLTKNQSELIKRIKDVADKNDLISAALINLNVKLDGMTNSNAIVENDSTIEFKSPVADTSLLYNIQVHGVRPVSGIKTKLEFQEFQLPNKQFIKFNWTKDKTNPVSFSITNTNKYFKVTNVDSYIIPEITKVDVKPTFLQRLGKFGKSSGGKIVIFGAGMLAGGLLLHK